MAHDYDATGWSEGAAGWVENEALFDSVYTPVTTEIVERAGFRSNERVLDVGCGSGTLLAAGTAAGSTMVGVDIAPDMVEAARRRVPEATVLLGDAQTMDIGTHAPGAPFERVVSRFGVMFFADPTAAFANVRSVTAPGARLVFACWRGIAENPSFGGAGTEAITAALPDPPAPPPPGSPGPMAFADRDHVATILADAGWDKVSVDPFDTVFDHSVDGSDGVDERLTLILATTTGRLAREQLLNTVTTEKWSDLVERTREHIRTHVIDGSVKLPGALWLVTASNQG
jgi:SAM-dependent methyltransferase